MTRTERASTKETLVKPILELGGWVLAGDIAAVVVFNILVGPSNTRPFTPLDGTPPHVSANLIIQETARVLEISPEIMRSFVSGAAGFAGGDLGIASLTVRNALSAYNSLPGREQK